MARQRRPGGGGGGVLPYKPLIGMCCWMGSHFHDWSDCNGVECNFRIFGVSRDSKWEDSRLKIRKLLFIKLNNKPGEGGVLRYITYPGMCRPTGS